MYLSELLLDQNNRVNDGVSSEALGGLQAVIEESDNIIHSVRGSEGTRERVFAHVSGLRAVVQVGRIED